MKKFILLPTVLASILVFGLSILSLNETNRAKIETPAKQRITVILGGDVMLGRAVMSTSLEKNDPTYPFAKIASFMQSADVAFVNLENPIVENCPLHTSGFVFCAPPQMIDGLSYAGVDIVSISNNHIFNYGEDGFEETKRHLSEADILYADDSDLAVKQLNPPSHKASEGQVIGFLAFDKSQQSNPKLTEAERKLVSDSDQKVDVLVVSMHWGVEYQDIALPGVRALAIELVDLGADVVVGHHPHWVQDYEYINGKPIYYSLGNLVFDQMWSEKTRTGMLVKLTFENGDVVEEEFVNSYMGEWAQPAIQ